MIRVEGGSFQGILYESPRFSSQRVSHAIQQTFEDSAPVLLNNFFSATWHFSYASKHAHVMPAFYFFGMVSFTLALPVRIALVALTALRSGYIFLQTLCRRQFHVIGKNMQESGLVFAASLGELGSCIIGLICPPIAYKIDEFIQKNTLINTWYGDYALTVWSDQVENTHSLGNSNPLGLDASRGESSAEYFWRGRHQLEKFIHPEEIEAQMPEMLLKIAAAGFLHLMLTGKQKIPEEGALQDKYNLIFEYIGSLQSTEHEGCVGLFKRYVDRIEGRRVLTRLELINYIFYALALNTEQVSEIKEHFKSGMETVETLKKQLQPLKKMSAVDMHGNRVTLYHAVKQAASELLNLSSAMASEHRQFLGMMLQDLR